MWTFKIYTRNTKTTNEPTKKPVISNTDKFFCFNYNVSNLYNNSVVEKIYGMTYIFTLLMFRKPNKTTKFTRIGYNGFLFPHSSPRPSPEYSCGKRNPFYPIRSASFVSIIPSFRFSFILRYFKVFQVSQIFTCGLSDLLLLAVGSLVVFVLREYILKVHHYSTYFSSIFLISFHYSTWFSSIFSISFHYSTCLSSILSIS
jgi:hypothetical protein